ncbi:MAG TPA: hypothetical protein VKD28_01170 [Gemmatimonadales bacterium]|nr:hypothetical protein [Gemmatimonadales bacterium]
MVVSCEAAEAGFAGLAVADFDFLELLVALCLDFDVVVWLLAWVVGLAAEGCCVGC